jgi:hypothetical protein
MAKGKNENTFLVVGGRFSYLHAWEPQAMPDDDGIVDPKNLRYSVSLILDKKKDKADIEKIKKGIDVAIEEGAEILKGKKRTNPNFKYPLHDGDEERPDDPAYRGCMYINANSKQAPQIVNAKVQKILDQAELYSGCYGNISISLFAFNKKGFGIGCGLGNIQKTKDGDPLSSRTTAEDDFQPIDVDDDDNDSLI